MERCLSYYRDFSELTGLQGAKRISYSLIDQGDVQNTRDSQYHIVVEESSGDGDKYEEIGLPSSSKVFAARILTFLFENAVPFDHCPEVVGNVCSPPLVEIRRPYGSACNQAAHC